MTTLNPFDFDADARDRIWRLLEINNVGYRDQLKQSVDTAGAQLELAKPSLFDRAKDGSFYAGPVVMAPPGTAYIVLAHHDKVFIVHLRAAPGHTFTECITQLVDYAKKIAGDEIDEWSAGAMCPVMVKVIEKYGHTPGLGNAVELESDHNNRIIGSLLLPIPEAARAEMFDAFEQIIAMGVCPVWVGLIGKGTVEGLCMAWPLPIALAPYARTVIED
jgi:hypothetical protein